jgi:hypothetical protein
MDGSAQIDGDDLSSHQLPTPPPQRLDGGQGLRGSGEAQSLPAAHEARPRLDPIQQTQSASG